jgi:hypothetical protein
VAGSDTEELQTTPLPIPEQPPAPEAQPVEAPQPVEAAELPVVATESVAAQPGRRRRWRGLTGSLAFGLAVLAVVVLAAGVLGLFTGAPGPGPAALIAHPVAAALALVAQYFADRRRGRAAGFAGVAIVVITAATLWFFWWA